MSEFLSGRKIDRAAIGLVNYMGDWRSRLGLPKRESIPTGFPTTISETIKSGAMKDLPPVAESVGGIANATQ